MAAIAINNQTLAGLLEVGDQVMVGGAPDDFVTVTARYERPNYVKLRLSLFDHTEQEVRVRYTDPVLLAPHFELVEKEATSTEE